MSPHGTFVRAWNIRIDRVLCVLCTLANSRCFAASLSLSRYLAISVSPSHQFTTVGHRVESLSAMQRNGHDCAQCRSPVRAYTSALKCVLLVSRCSISANVGMTDVCMYVCVHWCVYIGVCVCVRWCVCTLVCVNIGVCVCVRWRVLYIGVNIGVCVCVCVCVLE
jgi:hypothetical protein